MCDVLTNTLDPIPTCHLKIEVNSETQSNICRFGENIGLDFSGPPSHKIGDLLLQDLPHDRGLARYFGTWSSQLFLSSQMNLWLDLLFNVVKWWKYLRKEDVACPSLQEIGSCLYEISCFFPSLAFLQHRGVARTFVCTFWDENQLYLDSTTFSALTFVSSQQKCAFCNAADSYQVFLLWIHVYFEWAGLDDMTWLGRIWESSDHCKSCGNARFCPDWPRLK